MTKVYLMLRNQRKNYECQWTDPVTGRLKTKSTNTPRRREAERIAGALEAQINAGEFDDTPRTTWDTAADRYESEVLTSRAVKTLHKFRATRKAVRRIIDPKFIRSMSATQISKFQSGLREEGLAEATIKSHLAALKAFLNWAARMALILKVPHIVMPKRTGRMKHRPITLEEFERMLSVIPQAVRADLAPGWDFLLRGLWLSGLRLDEALRLRWDGGDISVNLTAERPRLKIEANADKSTKPRLLPITRDFAELLLSVEPAKRRGRVFRVIVPGQVAEMRLDTCSKFITRLGEKAGVCVAERPPIKPGDNPRKSWAGAHCFRRAFGTRWAKVMRPQQLQELMRHESITTTMTFYVADDIQDTENAAWSLVTNSPTNTDSKPTQKTNEGAGI